MAYYSIKFGSFTFIHILNWESDIILEELPDSLAFNIVFGR